MNDETNKTDKTAEQWAAFQKIWTDTFTRMMQLGFTFSPESAPPEFLRQIRSGIFQALTQSWDEFLRSPQFLEGMKQWGSPRSPFSAGRCRSAASVRPGDPELTRRFFNR